jgi:hypothetical protein
MRLVYAPLSTISAKLAITGASAGQSSRAGEHPSTGTRSAAESRPRTMAKLFNNAGDKPILPSILADSIGPAKLGLTDDRWGTSELTALLALD